MLLFITGVPGAGKTYYSVNKIFNEFIKSDTHYSFLYTNIAMFKFGVSPKFKEFNNSVFFDKISQLYSMYSQNCLESELIEKAKELEIFNSFFVIDEAHNFFDRERPELVFFLTYHRHFFCDIFLVSQNLLLIHYKYRYLAEYFVKAKSSSISLNPRVFSYNYFADDKFNEKLESVTLLKRKEVFQLYSAADVVRSKNFISKFFIYIILAIVVSLSVFLYLIHYFHSHSHSAVHRFNNVSHSSHSVIRPFNRFSHFSHSFSNLFYYPCFGDYCFIHSHSFSVFFLKNFSFVSFVYFKGRLFLKSSRDLSFLISSMKGKRNEKIHSSPYFRVKP